MEMTSYEPGTPSWVDLGAPDPAAACDFYSTLFGWKCENQGADMGEYRLAMLKGKSVAGIGPSQRPDIPPFWTTYVSVDDVEMTTKAVEAAGGQVLAPPMDVMGAGRMAVFADPTGAQFSAWQPQGTIGASFVNESGALTWNELTTRQTKEAKEFYNAVFGWEAKTDQMGPITYTSWLLDDRAIGGMIEIDDSWPAGTPTFWMAYFGIDNLDAASAKVKELGGSQMSEPREVPAGRFAAFCDPQGAVFSLMQLAAK